MSKKRTKPPRKPPRKHGWNYPRAGYGKIHRWIPSWRFVLGSIFTFFSLGIGTFVGLYIAIDVPDPADFALSQATTVYYQDGSEKLGTFAEADRKSVDLSEISEDLQHAVISSEDRGFYENNGIDPKGIIRAFWNNLQGKPLQGASTLTQQYAERYYTGQNSSITGKIREAILAIKIDRQQPKELILNNYLNTIYFGRGAYGVETAAHKYFGVSASELHLSQAALLAAIIPAPSAWDPAIDPDTAHLKFDRVLRRMVEDEWITQEQADAAEFPETIAPNSDSDFTGTKGYLLQEVRSELIDSGGFTAEQLDREGYTIVTTIDPAKQQAAVDSVNSLPADRPANNQVGLISVDPTNGEILAMYGGRDFAERQQNSATQDRAQAGSVFKIFGVTAALKSGMSPYKTYASPSPYTLPGTNQKFQNHANVSYGSLPLRTMIAYSVNTGFIQLNKEIGPAATAKMAVDMGLPKDLVGLDDNIGNILGSAAPTAKEMSRAVSTLANGGNRLNAVHIVREVKDPEGNVVYRGDTGSKQAIPAAIATMADYVIQGGVTPDGTADQLGKLQRDIAAKTGTSSGPRSAWVVSYTPNLVTVTDMYQVGDNGEEEELTPFGGVYEITGSSWPEHIAYEYLKVALADMEKVKFPDPHAIIDKRFPKPTPNPEPKPATDPDKDEKDTEEDAEKEKQEVEQGKTADTQPDQQTPPNEAPADGDATTNPDDQKPADDEQGNPADQGKP